MNAPARWFTAAVVAGLTVAGSAMVEGRQAPDVSGRGRFLELSKSIVNLDRIHFVEMDANDPKSGKVSVAFGGGNDWVNLEGEDTRTLLAALRATGVESPATGSRVLLFDDFDGKLALNWKPVRPDDTHVSLTKNPGKLTITTQRGSIHGEQPRDEQGEPIPAKNLYLIDNPLARDADFVLTTCVIGFTPVMSYQQAGLIVYGDDDNYLKWDYEFHWNQGEGQLFRCVVETAGMPVHLDGETTSGLNRYWLRLTKRGNRYEYAASVDGKTYRVHGETTWGDGSPTRVGILAKNGGMKEATEVDAGFEFFEMRSLATEKPGVVPRQE